MPFNDKLLIDLIVIGVHVDGTSHFLTIDQCIIIKIIPERGQHGIRSQGHRDGPVTEIINMIGAESSPAIGINGHDIIIHIIIFEAERQGDKFMIIIAQREMLCPNFGRKILPDIGG